MSEKEERETNHGKKCDEFITKASRTTEGKKMNCSNCAKRISVFHGGII